MLACRRHGVDAAVGLWSRVCCTRDPSPVSKLNRRDPPASCVLRGARNPAAPRLKAVAPLAASVPTPSITVRRENRSVLRIRSIPSGPSVHGSSVAPDEVVGSRCGRPERSFTTSKWVEVAVVAAARKSRVCELVDVDCRSLSPATGLVSEEGQLGTAAPRQEPGALHGVSSVAPRPAMPMADAAVACALVARGRQLSSVSAGPRLEVRGCIRSDRG